MNETDDGKTKAKTRDSLAIAQAKSDAKVAADGSVEEKQQRPLRYCSIPCRLTGKRGVLQASALPLLEHLHSYAVKRGIGAHVVSLVANSIVIANPTLSIPNFQLFYTQVWSDVDRYFTKSENKTAKFASEVDAFFAAHPAPPEATTLLSTPVPVLVRQTDCKALGMASETHLQNFRSRLVRHVKATVVRAQLQADVCVQDEQRLARLCVACIEAHTDKLAEATTKLDAQFADKDKPCHESVVERLRTLIAQERAALGGLLDRYEYEKTITTDKVKHKVKVWSTQTQLARALHDNKHAHELLSHSKRISDASLQLLAEIGLPTPSNHAPLNEDDADNADGDTCLDFDADDPEADEELEEPEELQTPASGTSEEERALWRVWTRSRRPKPFSLLPLAKCRRAMAYYGLTELEQMFSALRSADRKKAKSEAVEREQTGSRKRGRDEDETEGAMPKATQSDVSAPPWADAPDKDEIWRQVFTFKHIKGKRQVGDPAAASSDARGWRVACFRTNGVKTVLTFVSGTAEAAAAPHTPELLKKGYNIPVPREKVDMSTPRGLYRVQQKSTAKGGPSVRAGSTSYRNDLAADLQATEHDDACLLDAGFLRPFQGMEIPIHAMNASATRMAEAGSFWHLTKDEWMRESGRDEQARVETKRRNKNQAYRQAIDTLSSTRRRTADATTFAGYASASMATLDARCTELVAEARCRFRFEHMKLLSSFLSRVADRMANRTTNRLKSRLKREAGLTDEETEALRVKLRERRAFVREHNPRRMVFFGDGQFRSSMRGHPSMPKKKILKLLAVRVPTILLDEFRTSCQCPCGNSALIDQPLQPTDGKRVRVHKTDGGECSVLKLINDRDETATVNFVLAVFAAIMNAPWPVHLRR